MEKHRTRFISILLSIVLVVSLCPVPSFADAGSPSTPYPESDGLTQEVPTDSQFENAASNQLIVTYSNESKAIDDEIDVAEASDDKDPNEIASSEPENKTTLSDLGAVQEGTIDVASDECEGESSLVTFEEGTDLQEVSAQLLSSPEVEAVQPNFRYDLFAVGTTSYYDESGNRAAKHPTNDPYSFVTVTKELNQNYIYTTKIADAWDQGYKTSGKVSIAVIDSGPRTDHPDLTSALDMTYARDFTTTSTGTGVPYSDSAQYWTGKTGFECHGTWVSGILGATANNGAGIAGTSYNANVIPLKVTNGQTLYTSTIVRAYSYLDGLVESGKLPTLKVINLSLGGRESDSKLQSAITHMATSHKILTVASAGNYGDSAAVYPADYSNVLSVMATNTNLTRASFSNYGGKDVSAPGTSITTTSPYTSTWSSSARGKYSKSGISGTSFSAPIVSGVAAMCYAAKPTATAAEIRYAIKSSGESLAGIDSTCAPFLNALQAVKNTISGKGLYEATHTSIANAKVSSISTKTYSGKRYVPKPKVTLNGKTLKRGTDYTLVYSNNKNPGKATVTIKGMGAYKDSKKVTFKIIPKASRVVKLKGGKSSMTVSWLRRTACTTGYQIRYSISSKRFTTKKLRTGRTVTVSGSKKRSKTLKGLRPKTRFYVQVRTYKKSNGVYYYSKWSALKKISTK